MSNIRMALVVAVNSIMCWITINHARRLLYRLGGARRGLIRHDLKMCAFANGTHIYYKSLAWCLGFGNEMFRHSVLLCIEPERGQTEDNNNIRNKMNQKHDNIKHFCPIIVSVYHFINQPTHLVWPHIYAMSSKISNKYTLTNNAQAYRKSRYRYKPYTPFLILSQQPTEDEECLYFPISPKSTLTTATEPLACNLRPKNNIWRLLFIETSRPNKWEKERQAFAVTCDDNHCVIWRTRETLLGRHTYFLFTNPYSRLYWLGTSSPCGATHTAVTVRIWFINLLIAARPLLNNVMSLLFTLWWCKSNVDIHVFHNYDEDHHHPPRPLPHVNDHAMTTTTMQASIASHLWLDIRSTQNERSKLCWASASSTSSSSS